MTTNDLILQMENELYDTRLCKQDFEKYDVQSITECCEPFLWEVYENGTHLIPIGPTAILGWLGDEAMRMRLFRDIYAPISYVSATTPSEDCRLFYFDGMSLMPIHHISVRGLYDKVWHNAIQKELSRHPGEAEMANAPIKLVFSDGALERKKECEKKQSELCNTSFTDCLERLERRTRLAVNQEIRIGLDFADLSFIFGEYVNGSLRMNGGIIFYNGKWNIHT